MSTTVQCKCGEVKIELSGDPAVSLYCHCDDCRQVFGGAYVGMGVYPMANAKVVSGQPMIFKLKRTPRGTCKSCGTRVYTEIGPMGMWGITSTLLPPGTFKPAMHLICKEAVLPVRDGLPHFKGYPAAFGGSDEQVEW